MVPQEEGQAAPQVAQLAAERVVGRSVRLRLGERTVGRLGVVVQSQAQFRLVQQSEDAVDSGARLRDQPVAAFQGGACLVAPTEVEHEVDRVERVQPGRLPRLAAYLVHLHGFVQATGRPQPGDDPRRADHGPPGVQGGGPVESAQAASDIPDPHQHPVDRAGRHRRVVREWRGAAVGQGQQVLGGLSGAAGGQPVGQRARLGESAGVPQAPGRQQQCLVEVR